jgi:hypothetical protein
MKKTIILNGITYNIISSEIINGYLMHKILWFGYFVYMWDELKYFNKDDIIITDKNVKFVLSGFGYAEHDNSYNNSKIPALNFISKITIYHFTCVYNTNTLRHKKCQMLLFE